jgi:hypothetical protein
VQWTQLLACGYSSSLTHLNSNHPLYTTVPRPTPPQVEFGSLAIKAQRSHTTPSTVGAAPEPSEVASPHKELCTGIGRWAVTQLLRPEGWGRPSVRSRVCRGSASDALLPHLRNLDTNHRQQQRTHPFPKPTARVAPLISAEPESAFLPFPDAEGARRRSSSGGGALGFGQLKQRRTSTNGPAGGGGAATVAAAVAAAAPAAAAITRQSTGGLGGRLSRLGSAVANLVSGGGAAPAVAAEPAPGKRQ